MENENRKLYLLKIALKYLKKIKEGQFVDALGETIEYDEADCDGFCLIEDIELELESKRIQNYEQI